MKSLRITISYQRWRLRQGLEILTNYVTTYQRSTNASVRTKIRIERTIIIAASRHATTLRATAP